MICGGVEDNVEIQTLSPRFWGVIVLAKPLAFRRLLSSHKLASLPCLTRLLIVWSRYYCLSEGGWDDWARMNHVNLCRLNWKLSCVVSRTRNKGMNERLWLVKGKVANCYIVWNKYLQGVIISEYLFLQMQLRCNGNKLRIMIKREKKKCEKIKGREKIGLRESVWIRKEWELYNIDSQCAAYGTREYGIMVLESVWCAHKEILGSSSA